jgi:hypothetical protein
MLIYSLGKDEQDTPTVVRIEIRTLSRSYGVIDGGFEVMRAAWPKLEHVFSVRRSGDSWVKGERSPEPDQVWKEPHRLSNTLLSNSPVDLLTVERGSLRSPSCSTNIWEKLVSKTETSKRPRVILESWPPNAQLWTKGPTCKSTTTRWNELDFVSQCKRVDATKVGGAINQSRLLVARVRKDWSHLWF